MIRPLHDNDCRQVRELFQRIFDRSEYKYYANIWEERTTELCLSIWNKKELHAAALVRNHKLEYIFVHESYRSSGIGTKLLRAILQKCPSLYLVPVNDERIIRWYESMGFSLSSITGECKCYVHHPYATRSKVRISI
jgi:GNAT superfamily N-acetyltransferase